jgi:hypothetical protein
MHPCYRRERATDEPNSARNPGVTPGHNRERPGSLRAARLQINVRIQQETQIAFD